MFNLLWSSLSGGRRFPPGRVYQGNRDVPLVTARLPRQDAEAVGPRRMRSDGFVPSHRIDHARSVRELGYRAAEVCARLRPAHDLPGEGDDGNGQIRLGEILPLRDDGGIGIVHEI